MQKGECVYKAPHSFGKLVLSPYFTDPKELDSIALPEQRKSQETQETRQDEGSKESPEPPEAVF